MKLKGEPVARVLPPIKATNGTAGAPVELRDLHETFVSRAHRLDTARHHNAALDLIYDSMDEMMRKGEFDSLNSLLANINVADLSVDLLLGLLTATLPAKSRLPSR